MAHVVAMKVRAPGHISAEAVEDIKKDELQGDLEVNVLSVAKVYSDVTASYDGVPQSQEAIQHGIGVKRH